MKRAPTHPWPPEFQAICKVRIATCNSSSNVCLLTPTTNARTWINIAAVSILSNRRYKATTKLRLSPWVEVVVCVVDRTIPPRISNSTPTEAVEWSITRVPRAQNRMLPTTNSTSMCRGSSPRTWKLLARPVPSKISSIHLGPRRVPMGRVWRLT